MPRKREHYVLVKISAPWQLTANEVRREVRTLINEQCNHSAEPEDIRARKIMPVPKSWIGEAADQS